MEPSVEPSLEPPVEISDAISDATAGEPLDLDRIERDLAEVERTLERLGDGTYWSDGSSAVGDATSASPGS